MRLMLQHNEITYKSIILQLRRYCKRSNEILYKNNDLLL